MQVSSYSDDRGNVILWEGDPIPNTDISFVGHNNTMRIDNGARVGRLQVTFDCDNGALEIGPSKGVPAFSGWIRVGQDSRVIIGRNVSTTAPVLISASEGTTVQLGDDCMLASGVQIRADDGHPIFDVRNGKRVNLSRSISVGAHVWLAYNSVILGGATIGAGSVVGFGSVVTRNVPNNAIAAGVPAKVVRKDVAWERPHLSMTRPFYKPDASTIQKSPWWGRTVSSDEGATLTHRVTRLENLWPIRTWTSFSRWRRGK